MALAIFDLDKTLIAGDSDFLWGEFLTEINVVDKDVYQQKNKQFFIDYQQQKLDIFKYLEFCLEPLATNDISQLKIWRKEFVQKKILPIILKEAQKTINQHKKNGDTLLVITATNQFIVEPIIKRYKIKNILATKIEKVNNMYTGKVVGEPCFKKGKVVNLLQWLKLTNNNLDNSYFYSDSINDLPLLELVAHPIATNPDDKLKKIALSRGWKIIHWSK